MFAALSMPHCYPTIRVEISKRMNKIATMGAREQHVQKFLTILSFFY